MLDFLDIAVSQPVVPQENTRYDLTGRRAMFIADDISLSLVTPKAMSLTGKGVISRELGAAS